MNVLLKVHRYSIQNPILNVCYEKLYYFQYPFWVEFVSLIPLHFIPFEFLYNIISFRIPLCFFLSANLPVINKFLNNNKICII